MVDNAHYCDKCGASVAASAPRQDYAAPGGQIYTAPNIAPGNAGWYSDKSNAICIVLAVLLLLQTVVVSLFGWPGFAVKSRASRPGPGREAGVSQTDGAISFSDITLKGGGDKAKPIAMKTGSENKVPEPRAQL